MIRLSARAKRRNPCDQGKPEQRAVAAFRWMLNIRYWRRHTKPWAKTLAGKRRRQERLFVADSDNRIYERSL